MKHAILILAHKDFSLLQHLIDYFNKDCYIYVHVDKKAVITKEEMALIGNTPQVRAIFQEFSVNWGGFSILEAELFLFERAYMDGKADYFHLISGQDYPIKTLEVFIQHFEQNRDVDYIEFKPFPIVKWQDSFFDRYRYYYLADDVNWQSTTGKRFMGECVKLQERFCVRRKPIQEFDIIYKGSQWMSLTKASVEKVLDYTHRHPSFLYRLNYTFAPEESYIHTILLNRGESKIHNCNLRYIRWNKENGNNPSNLGIEHFDGIRVANAFFARKMERPFCIPLIKEIDKQLLKESNEI